MCTPTGTPPGIPPTKPSGTPPGASEPFAGSSSGSSADGREPSGLLQYIHARFRESFGQPTTMRAHDSQWTLRPDGDRPAIFILVNGSYEKPAVWIFDPYDAVDNVWKASIHIESEVDRAIAEISRRMESAADSRPLEAK